MHTRLSKVSLFIVCRSVYVTPETMGPASAIVAEVSLIRAVIRCQCVSPGRLAVVLPGLFR